MTPGFFRAAGVMASIVVAAVSAEVALRVVDFPPQDFSPWVEERATGYAYAPFVDTRFRREGEFDIAFATNREGLRDDEIGPKTTRRVVLLGDSFASGYGVDRGEMFADLLEQDLKIDVVNAAVGGYEIIHQVRYYESRGRHYDADVVLYALYLANDLSRNDQWRETDDGALVPVDRRWPIREVRGSKLLVLFEHVLYRQRVRRDDAREEWEPFDDYLRICERTASSETRRQWQLVEDLLERLDDLVIASDARLVIAPFSHRTANDPSARARYLEHHPAFLTHHDFAVLAARVTEITGRLGIDRIDLDAAIADHYARGGEPLYFPRDGHWNAAGHRVASAALAGPLRAVLDAPKPEGDRRA